ncbi:hypothetical protein [Curtobacterium sp. MCJR17_043]|uniref:hypothetical protein n=1 Tax=Curtobacterium sp. MCJR17_043 TaxID=2175660 RepID=UPI0024DF3DC5|nr:hypothetical protein [Curtobacterium sp. MCJR17_043]WIB34930.1 hypothetical protein DEJ15_10325 [Curtobacterium sp. MCJR17_043]
MPETTALPRPPFDPEFVPFLTAMDERGRFHLTTAMLPQMRQLDMTEAQLDEGLRARGLERRSITVPGHLGEPIALAVVQRIGRTGPAACAYAIHGGGMVFGHHLGNLDSYNEWLLVHDVVLVSPDYRLAPRAPRPLPGRGLLRRPRLDRRARRRPRHRRGAHRPRRTERRRRARRRHRDPRS